jgi:hypothetical protein
VTLLALQNLQRGTNFATFRGKNGFFVKNPNFTPPGKVARSYNKTEGKYFL